MEAAAANHAPRAHQRHHSATSIGISSNYSVSLASVSSEGSADSHLVEQEDIVALTHDVRAFKEALGKLRRIFHPDKEKQETLRVAAHERLGEVLRILRTVLERYTPLQSTELFMAAGALIQQVKQHNYEEEKADPTEFFESIDQLALAFSSRVSEYLMGDLDSSSSTVLTSSSSKAKSCENLASDAETSVAETRDDCGATGQLTPQQLDATLHRLDQGVEVALHRAKVWSKYAKDVLSYVEKRAALEMEYSKNLAKLAQTMRFALKEDSFLPFQSIYCTALDQDLENCSTVQNTCTLLQGHKFIEPLGARRTEHERNRKHIKELWHRELKKMHETVANLRKAKVVYVQRQQEYERAREIAQRAEAVGEQGEPSRTEKKRRIEEDALEKAQQAEMCYRECVREANERHAVLQKVKGDVLTQVRELILQCDQTMKAVTVSYFQLQHTAAAPVPVQYQTLCESSRLYEPGSQYSEFVKRLLPPARSNRDVTTGPVPASGDGPFAFEPYGAEDGTSGPDKKSNGTFIGADEASQVSDSGAGGRPAPSVPPQPQPGRPWPAVGGGGGGGVQHPSDTDSVDSSRSNKSVDTSPTASPLAPGRHRVQPGDDLETEQETDGYVTRHAMSKAAVTHRFKKLITPSRCRECDSYVYFQGLECTECGLTTHKKCLETLAIQCGHKRLPRKMTTFGVDLSHHLAETGATIPHLVCKCVAEIDHKGTRIKGIYRVSGVKSRVEKLCQAFENGSHLVDLTDVHPNVVANVLKLYLRQLPEPLLCFRLYSDFIRIAKDHPTNESDLPAAIRELQTLCKRLPRPHYVTVAFLMHHLQRVSRESTANNMPPSNLGIVFGPTLLRTSEGSASLSSLVDTVHQTRVIELMVRHAAEVFGPAELVTPADFPHRYRLSSRRGSARPQERRSREETFNLPEELLGSQSEDNSPNEDGGGGGSGRPRSLIYRGSLRDYMGLEGASVSSVSSSLERSIEDRLASQDSREDLDNPPPPQTQTQTQPQTQPQRQAQTQPQTQTQTQTQAQTQTQTQAEDRPPIVKVCLKSYIGLESFQSQSSPSLLNPPESGQSHPRLRKSISDNSASSGTMSPVDGGVYMGGETEPPACPAPAPGESARRRPPPPPAAQSLPEGEVALSSARHHRPLGRITGELVRAGRVSSLDVPPDHEPATTTAAATTTTTSSTGHPLPKLSGQYVSPYISVTGVRGTYHNYAANRSVQSASHQGGATGGEQVSRARVVGAVLKSGAAGSVGVDTGAAAPLRGRPGRLSDSAVPSSSAPALPAPLTRVPSTSCTPEAQAGDSRAAVVSRPPAVGSEVTARAQDFGCTLSARATGASPASSTGVTGADGAPPAGAAGSRSTSPAGGPCTSSDLVARSHGSASEPSARVQDTSCTPSAATASVPSARASAPAAEEVRGARPGCARTQTWRASVDDARGRHGQQDEATSSSHSDNTGDPVSEGQEQFV